MAVKHDGTKQLVVARWLMILGLCLVTLGCGLTEAMQQTPRLSATDVPPALMVTGTATPTATTRPKDGADPTATKGAPQDDAVAPTATPTETPPAPTATNTPPPAPTDTQPPTATATYTPEGLAIVAFDVTLEDTGGGSKRLTCTWETTGAEKVHVIVGTSQRFSPWKEETPNGSTTFDLDGTNYRNPDVFLVAYSSAGDDVQEKVTLDWPCRHRYFFESALPASEIPDACPVNAPLETAAAQQAFERGAMFWLQGVEGQDVIYIIYNDGSWDRYEDTWAEGMPEQDPNITPPAGLQQPIRGFGKVWRENTSVRDKVGWVLSGEAGYTATYQRQMQESLGGVQYVRTLENKIVRLNGLGGSGSTWSYLP